MRPVTVDTGGPDDIYRGALVVWIHVPRGGYGYQLPIRAKVLLVGREKARIEMKKKDGSLVERVVKVDSLRWCSRDSGLVSIGGDL